MNSSIVYAIAAYAIWGLFPFISHRIIWSWLILIVVVVASKQWRSLRAITTRRIAGTYAIAAMLISINWLVYVWAVNHGNVVQTSLGYFITPLLNVLLGTIFFRERLRPWQWFPLALAVLGVGYLTLAYGAVPWIALALASSFALYGMVKKTAPLNSLFGMTLETAILLLPALIYLVFCDDNGSGAFAHIDRHTDALLILGGMVTAIPLLLFASAAQRISLTLIGILQYIAPTLQILLGIFFFHEPFSSAQLTGFSLVWIALAIFVVGGLATRKPVPQPNSPAGKQT